MNIRLATYAQLFTSVHKRDENRSERRRLSAVGAVGTPALGKSAGDTLRQCPVEPARAGNGMPKGKKCSAVPEERRPKRGLRRRSIDALPKGGNNPECRGVVPAGERRSEHSAFSGRTDAPVSSEAPKGVYKTEG